MWTQWHFPSGCAAFCLHLTRPPGDAAASAISTLHYLRNSEPYCHAGVPSLGVMLSLHDCTASVSCASLLVPRWASFCCWSLNIMSDNHLGLLVVVAVARLLCVLRLPLLPATLLICLDIAVWSRGWLGGRLVRRSACEGLVNEFVQ